MKNVVDSNGIVWDTKSLKNPFKIKKYEKRIEEFHEIKDCLLNLFAEKNIPVSEKSFYFMVQPMYKEERILFFTKIPLLKESDFVQQCQEARKNPEYQFQNEKQADQLKSILVSEQNQYWLVNVEMLILERNLYDCEYISIRQSPPIPLYHFMKQIPTMIAESPEMITLPNDFRYCFYPEIPTRMNESALLENAIVRDAISSRDNSAELDKRLFYIIYEMTQKLEIVKETEEGRTEGKDAFSNLETLYLHYINECSLQLSQDTFYEIYQNIKSTIKQVYPNSFGISYHKKPSFVAFTEGQRKATIYIINETLFLNGGKLYTDMESLKQALQKESCFEEPPWFREKVIPYIENSESQPKLA